MTASDILSTIGTNFYTQNNPPRNFIIAFWMFRKNLPTIDNCYFKISDKLSLCFDQNLNLQFMMQNFLFTHINQDWESNFRLSYLNNYLNTRSEQWNYFKFVISISTIFFF